MADPTNGPQEPMLVLTRAMKPGPTRVGKVAGNLSLPRSVELPTAVAVVCGAVTGMVLFMAFGGGFMGAMYGMLLGGTLGWVAMNYSPLEGETLLRWVGLNVRARRGQVLWQGQPVQVSIGICPIPPVVSDQHLLRPGAVNVPSTQYDRRGVRISAKNRNLDEAASSTVWAPDDRGGGFTGAGAPLTGGGSTWLEAAAAPDRGGPRRRIRLPDLDDALGEDTVVYDADDRPGS